MNLATLENRAQEINKSITSLTAQLNALHGHLAECNHWKSELSKVDVKEEIDMKEHGMCFAETPESEEVDASQPT